MTDFNFNLAARLLWEAFDHSLLDPVTCIDPIQVIKVNDFQFVDCEGEDSGGITSFLILAEKFEKLEKISQNNGLPWVEES